MFKIKALKKLVQSDRFYYTMFGLNYVENTELK